MSDVMGIPNSDFIDAIGEIENDQVREAIIKMKNDPSKVFEVIRSVEDNTEVLGHITNYIKNNKELQNNLGSMMGADTGSMTRKERLRLAKKMKRAQHSVKTETNTITTTRITSTRQIKTMEVQSDFPNKTIFETHEPYEIRDGIFLYYDHDNTAKNRLLSKIAGFKIGGEGVFLRMDVDGEITPFGIKDYIQIFGKK